MLPHGWRLEDNLECQSFPALGPSLCCPYTCLSDLQISCDFYQLPSQCRSGRIMSLGESIAWPALLFTEPFPQCVWACVYLFMSVCFWYLSFTVAQGWPWTNSNHPQPLMLRSLGWLSYTFNFPMVTWLNLNGKLIILSKGGSFLFIKCSSYIKTSNLTRDTSYIHSQHSIGVGRG